jgi:hypothetical protein
MIIPITAIMTVVSSMFIGMCMGLLVGIFLFWGNDKGLKYSIIGGMIFGLLAYLVKLQLIVFV